MEISLKPESDLFDPTPAHRELREVVRKFSEGPLREQARHGDESEKFNIDLFRRLGSELGILGLTVPEDQGGRYGFFREKHRGHFSQLGGEIPVRALSDV